MGRLTVWIGAGALAVAVVACGDAAPDRVAVEGADPPAAGPEEVHTADHGAAAHDHGGEHDALALRPIMQRLSSDMAGLAQAIWFEDYEAMTTTSAAVADHPHISDDEMQRIEAELGIELSTFHEMDEAVHESAVRLHNAAATRQLDEVLDLFSEVQRGCVACHTEFRERLRTVP